MIVQDIAIMDSTHISAETEQGYKLLIGLFIGMYITLLFWLLIQYCRKNKNIQNLNI